MNDARLDEIRALATDWRTPLLSTSLHAALRDLLEAHDGLRSRVLGLATELEGGRRGAWHTDAWFAERVRRCL